MSNSACGVTLVKRFTYRGDASEEYSNTYWFDGTTPADEAAWKTLADALFTSEKTILPPTNTLVKAYGYSVPNDVAGVTAAWQYDYLGEGETVVGTYALSTTGISQGGDTAGWIRWRTNRRTSPGGKIIYLRKYYHPAITAPAGGDTVLAAWRTAALAHGTKLIDGTLPATRQLCGMRHAEDGNDLTVAGIATSPFVTTRTLKRRGKRAT